MDKVINPRIFLEKYTYFCKLCIFSNKGTTIDEYLEKIVAVHNKYKKIELSVDTTDVHMKNTVRLLKRFNLSLKVQENGSKIDMSDGSAVAKLLDYVPNAAIVNSDVDLIRADGKMQLITGIPVSFCLSEGPYSNLIWNYILFLFYASEIILTELGSNYDVSDPIVIKKLNIREKSLEMLPYTVANIKMIEESTHVSDIMNVDRYLNLKLIEEDGTDQAGAAVKKMFAARGVDNPELSKMLDIVVGKLKNSEVSAVNFVPDIISIARSTISEMGDAADSMGNMKDIMGVITDVFKSSAADSTDLPDNVKDIMSKLSSLDGDMNDSQVKEAVDKLQGELSGLGVNYEDVMSKLSAAVEPIDPK